MERELKRVDTSSNKLSFQIDIYTLVQIGICVRLAPLVNYPCLYFALEHIKKMTKQYPSLKKLRHNLRLWKQGQNVERDFENV